MSGLSNQPLKSAFQKASYVKRQKNQLYKLVPNRWPISSCIVLHISWPDMEGTVGVGLVATSKSLSPALVGQGRYFYEVADLRSLLSLNASFTDKLCPCSRFWTFSYIESKNRLSLLTLSDCIFDRAFSTWFSNCSFWLLVTLYIFCLTFGESLREFLLCQSPDILSHLRLSSSDLRSHPVDRPSLNSVTSLEVGGGCAVSPLPAASQRRNVN